VFVDGASKTVHYGTPSGAPYGSAVAEKETELVLTNLMKLSGSKYIQEIRGDLEGVEVQTAIDEMFRRKFMPNLILTNIDQSFRFWEFKQFKPLRMPRKGLRFPEGYFEGIPVHYSRLLPSGLTIIVDSNRLGCLEVKTDFDVSVSNIREDTDKRAVQQQFPNLDLDEKVRILCLETVKSTIQTDEPYAFLMIKHIGTKLKIEQPSS